MSNINKTLNKGLNLPEHYDPSVEKLRENMNIIDSLLQKSVPNDLQTTSDGEDNINNLVTTGRYFVKNSATGCPITSNTGIVDVFRAGTYVLQEWRSVSSPSLMYRRYSSNGGSSWNSWIRVWNESNDGDNSGLDADTLDGNHLSSLYRKDFIATDFNSATSEGKYKINGGTNAPNTNCSDWVCLVYYLSGGADELYQIAMEECHTVPDLGESKGNLETPNSTEYSTGTPCMFVRKRIGGTWYAWETIFNSGVVTPVRTFRSTASQDIDSCKEEGMYDYKSITSSSTLPVGSSTGYGLIVKSLNGADSTGSDCCLQMLMTDGSTHIYIRTYHNSIWSSWKLLGITAEDILTKLKTVDGAGSELDSDTVDGKHASDFVQSVKSTTTTNIDNVTLEGMYEYANVTSSKTLPPFTGSGGAYGLIVKSAKGNSSYDCCFQIMLKDGCDYIYMRYFHSGSWSDWTKINPTAGEILSSLKTVDGDGSGLDADMLDGRYGYGYAHTGESSSILPGISPSAASSIKGLIYKYTGKDITGSSSENFGIFQIYSPSYFARIAVSMNTGKVYVQTNGASAWSEITPLIPVLSANPSNPSEGQMWILK